MTNRLFESLEGRRLLSASTGFVGYIPTPIGPTADVSVPASGAPTTTPVAVTLPAVRPTNLVGNWEGKVTAKIVIIKKRVDAELTITAQTATSITGKIVIDGHDYDGTFTGKISKNGHFKYKLKDGDGSLTLSGTLDRKGSYMYGSVKGKYHGFSAKGRFEFNQPSDPNATPIT
jgi:hypothetical protein